MAYFGHSVAKAAKSPKSPVLGGGKKKNSPLFWTFGVIKTTSNEKNIIFYESAKFSFLQSEKSDSFGRQSSRTKISLYMSLI